MKSETPWTVTRDPAGMEIVEAFGDKAVFHLTGEDTGGKFCLFTLETPPGGGPPPHCHAREDEWFLVREGSAEFLLNGEWAPVPVGSSVFAPMGTVPSFRNAGQTPLILTIQTAPAGFERFFGEMAAEFQKQGGPDMAEVVRISEGYGITYPQP